MTPAMFMVSALVFPISMNTLMLRPKAAAALDRKMGMSRCTWRQHSMLTKMHGILVLTDTVPPHRICSEKGTVVE